MYKGNSSTSNRDVPNYQATRDEYWPSFNHYPDNTNETKNGDYIAICRKCNHTFKYNMNEDISEDGHEFRLKIHYQWHINVADKRKDRRNQLPPRSKRIDWSEYYKPPKPINEQQPRENTGDQTPISMVESIFNFRGDHTVICTKCGEIFNYKETILREHYDEHDRREGEETLAKYREAERIKWAEYYADRARRADRAIEESRKKALREEEEKKKWREEIQNMQMRHKIQKAKREEERRNAERYMAEIEKQEADAAFWNEAAHMADNAGASNQQEKEDEDDEPWWDELLQYADSQNL